MATKTVKIPLSRVGEVEVFLTAWDKDGEIHAPRGRLHHFNQTHAPAGGRSELELIWQDDTDDASDES